LQKTTSPLQQHFYGISYLKLHYVPGEMSFIVSAKTSTSQFSKNSGIIVYHSRTVRKNFKIFNKTGKDFVLIQ
jgi:hypothetical protein